MAKYRLHNSNRGMITPAPSIRYTRITQKMECCMEDCKTIVTVTGRPHFVGQDNHTCTRHTTERLAKKGK